MHVTLYSKPDCPLCEEVGKDLQELRKTMGFALAEVNVLQNADAWARYHYLIPVVDIEGGEILLPPHDWSRLDSALRAAEKAGNGTRTR